LVSPWNREFGIAGINFYRVNASLNTAFLGIDTNIFACEGISVTQSALKCRLSSSTSLPLDVGDVVVREVISNGVSSGSIRVRIAYITLPPGYGLGPGYAPDGSPLPSGFGSLTSTILVIIVLSGLIVLVLLTFMILSGRTGGYAFTILQVLLLCFARSPLICCRDQRAARSLFSTRAVGTVITLVQGPLPPRYQPLVPPEAEVSEEDAEEESTRSSAPVVVEVYDEAESDESRREKKRKRRKDDDRSEDAPEEPNVTPGPRSTKPETSMELDSLNSDSEEDSEDSDSGSDS
jgi:hypothetical protein